MNKGTAFKSQGRTWDDAIASTAAARHLSTPIAAVVTRNPKALAALVSPGFAELPPVGPHLPSEGA